MFPGSREGCTVVRLAVGWCCWVAWGWCYVCITSLLVSYEALKIESIFFVQLFGHPKLELFVVGRLIMKSFVECC